MSQLEHKHILKPIGFPFTESLQGLFSWKQEMICYCKYREYHYIHEKKESKEDS